MNGANIAGGNSFRGRAEVATEKLFVYKEGRR